MWRVSLCFCVFVPSVLSVFVLVVNSLFSLFFSLTHPPTKTRHLPTHNGESTHDRGGCGWRRARGAGADASSPLVASVVAHTLAAKASGTTPEEAPEDALESVTLAEKGRVKVAAAAALPVARTAVLARRLATDAVAAAQRSGRSAREELEDAVAEFVPLAAAAGVLAAGVAGGGGGGARGERSRGLKGREGAHTLWLVFLCVFFCMHTHAAAAA